MAKRSAPHSGNFAAPYSGNSLGIGLDNSPPFLPLEEDIMRSRSGTEEAFYDQDGNANASASETPSKSKSSSLSLPVPKNSTGMKIKSRIPKLEAKTVVLILMVMIFGLIIWDAFFTAPEDRLLRPDFSDKLLLWVQSNPGWGLGAISLVIAAAVVSMVPIGTPLTFGCGYIYRGVYGWKLGLFVATAVSMAGSCLGAVTCFFLGRYLMRDQVRKWVRKYPLFDAIDVAASENGLRIMAMLYLTPVLPLGLVSYMCGTTSMNVYHFAGAKIAALPIYLIYTFMGASAHSFIKKGGGNTANGNGELAMSTADESKQLEENQMMIVAGIVLSVIMVGLITRHIKKELMTILDRQKKHKPGETSSFGGDDIGGDDDDTDGETAVELGMTARRRGHKTEQHTEDNHNLGIGSSDVYHNI